MEAWKEIQSFKGYWVSRDGRVKTTDYNHTGKESLIKIFKNVNGYMACNLMRNGIRKRALVHRLVASAFIPNEHNLATVNHKNGSKTDNCVENLEWMTSSDNLKHAHRNGMIKQAHGETHYKAKLSSSDVFHIRELIQSGMGNTEIAKQFGVVHQTISHIRHNKHRKHETNRDCKEVSRA
jgi:hypothetical protein